MSTQTVTEQATAEVVKLADQNVDSTDTEMRYMAYFARIRTALRATTRYFAYTSDVGEAFRPIVPPWIVTSAYGISWLYVLGDVSYETFKAKRKGPAASQIGIFTEPERLGLVAVKRGTFQAVASMGLPALTIHTMVKQAKRLFKNAQSTRVKMWGPTFTGLAIVPALPYLFDKPVEEATDKMFDWVEEKWKDARAKGDI